MYNLLIVDDEPMICKGLSNLLESSGLDINKVMTATSGQQALDYLRMEDIKLIVTDIQMGSMNGIELLQQAKLINPWIQAIFITAHEMFEYAQLAIRLGAKDYLVKPLNSEQFLDSVRNVRLKAENELPNQKAYLLKLQEDFHMDETPKHEVGSLNRFIQDPTEERMKNLESMGVHLTGPYFSILKVKLLSNEEQENKKGEFLHYAALNIINELLGREWNHLTFYSNDQQGVNIVVQWNDKQYERMEVNKITQLELIGRSIYSNIESYLGINCVVSISQILKGISFLPTLHDQATKALKWYRQHPGHYVFYYGDFNWNAYSEEPSSKEVITQHSFIVDQVKDYIEEKYNQKGLTMQGIAHENHVSPNYLSYLFKRETGYNLWEYVIMKRMEESKKLLLHSDLRRYEIADRIGYESPEHFSKIFKKYFGVSPSEFKK